MPTAAPLSLKTYDWEHCYAPSDLRADDQPVVIHKDFYIPVLSRSTGYDGVAGYPKRGS